MKLSELVIKFSYSPFLIRTIRFLHLRGLMRRVYYRLISPKDKILAVDIKGLRGKFYVRTPLELRAAGVLLKERLSGERMVLEKMLQVLSGGDVVYDIGANLGIHTIFLAKHVKNTGRVVAFEPEKKSYEALLDNIGLNNLSNVIPRQLALGDIASEGSLYWRGGIVGSYSLMGDSSDTVVKQKVRIMPGDLLAKELDCASPAAVKIDVEGYEYQVISGLKGILSSEACRMVCCEVHPGMFLPEINSEVIIQLLKSYGFKRIEKTKPEKTFYLFCYKT